MSAAGPPTPPPTSAVEIADEAREAALEAAAAAAASQDTIGSAPPTAPETDAIHAPAEPASTEPAATAPVGSSATDSVIPGDGAQPPSSTASSTISEFITQSIIPTIVAASADKNWQEVIRIAEDAEIQARTFADKTTIAVPLLLAYLIEDELPPARYAIRRLPLNLQSHPAIALLSSLVEATESRNHANVYSYAKSFLDKTQEISAENATMATIASGMISVFLDTFRLRVFALITKAYSSLPLSLAEKYTGLPGEQILAAAQLNGWTYETSSQTLYPKPSKRAASTLSSTLSTIDFVANSVAKLEL